MYCAESSPSSPPVVNLPAVVHLLAVAGDVAEVDHEPLDGEDGQLDVATLVLLRGQAGLHVILHIKAIFLLQFLQ